MAAPRNTKAAYAAERTFDVEFKVKVGSIQMGKEGDDSAIEAAFKMVARNAEPGTYEFTIPERMSPSGSDLTTRLVVEYGSPLAMKADVDGRTA